MQSMTSVSSLGEILRDADAALEHGQSAAASVQPSGFPMLDAYLDGGLRGGELTLIGGAQGLGKTTLALQMLTHSALSGTGGVVISFEHDAPSLLARLIASVAPEAHDLDALSTNRVRAALELADDSAGGLADRLAEIPGGAEALSAFGEVAERLLVHQATGSTTDLPTIAAVVRDAMVRLGGTPLVVVDYLQKVPVPGSRAPEDEQVTDVVEGLKDLAVETGCPVVAIVAAEKEALAAGTRLRLHHLRGSSALAYEADVVLLLHDKYDIVARHHLVFNTSGAERFRSWAVLSIEKNRSGLQGVDDRVFVE
jgi:replicative DNA helicase